MAWHFATYLITTVDFGVNHLSYVLNTPTRSPSPSLSLSLDERLLKPSCTLPPRASVIFYILNRLLSFCCRVRQSKAVRRSRSSPPSEGEMILPSGKTVVAIASTLCPPTASVPYLMTTGRSRYLRIEEVRVGEAGTGCAAYMSWKLRSRCCGQSGKSGLLAAIPNGSSHTQRDNKDTGHT